MNYASHVESAELFYDGSCPLCRREMCMLGKYKQHNLTLTDVHSLQDEATKQRMLKTLHLRQGNHWLTGLDANIAMWQYTKYGWLWRIFRLPVLYSIARFVYVKWSAQRYQKRYGKGITPC